MLTLELIAGALVFGAWIVFVRHQRHRLINNQCVKCGYDRHGLSERSVCPECGAQPTDKQLQLRAAVASRAPRYARSFVLLWLLLFVLWLGISALAVERQPYESPFVQMNKQKSENRERDWPIPTQFTVTTMRNSYGWPIQWFKRHCIQRYIWIAGQEARAQTITPGRDIATRDDHIQIQNVRSDKRTIELTMFYWPYALLQVSLLQFIALPLAVPAALLGRRWRRRRAHRSTTAGSTNHS